MGQEVVGCLELEGTSGVTTVHQRPGRGKGWPETTGQWPIHNTRLVLFFPVTTGLAGTFSQSPLPLKPLEWMPQVGCSQGLSSFQISPEWEKGT